ncbi:hypothetical protein CPB83DRAFT_839377 [Crepidotus variabilis]|uniref:Uncharacterized protein n=1 Tax=Crepidotus variabilis TaxID=179855 RepID=A0A9P6E7G7_9AGAR|nr:hypothetical protein CPB83DRAFT_839377 [Crepidotus variabilis]
MFLTCTGHYSVSLVYQSDAFWYFTQLNIWSIQLDNGHEFIEKRKVLESKIIAAAPPSFVRRQENKIGLRNALNFSVSHVIAVLAMAYIQLPKKAQNFMANKFFYKDVLNGCTYQGSQ